MPKLCRQLSSIIECLDGKSHHLTPSYLRIVSKDRHSSLAVISHLGCAQPQKNLHLPAKTEKLIQTENSK